MYKCFICGKQIKRPPSSCRGSKLFCNHKCYSRFKKTIWKGKNNPRYSGGMKEYKCLECKKKFFRKGYGIKNSKNKFCSRKCHGIYWGKTHNKENHWNWQGIDARLTAPVRSTALYEKWRYKILRRDDFTCQKCGSDKYLHIHHIKELSKLVREYKIKFGKLNVYDEIFYQTNNGKTLCRKCHYKLHTEQIKKLG